MKYIERITGEIPHTHKTVDIELKGKNLIVTGANGSGKTSLLQAINYIASTSVNSQGESNLKKVTEQLKELRNMLLLQENGSVEYNRYKQKIDNMEHIASEFEIAHSINVIFTDKDVLINNYNNNKATLCYYEDKRYSEIAPASVPQSLADELDTNLGVAQYKNVGKYLEQHLLNLKTRRSFAITEDNNMTLADEIDRWFNSFESILKRIFEDDEIKLKFDTHKNRNKFLIQQKEKPLFSFQTLSAGYSAIFDVYADLLMRTEYFGVKPFELEGIVFVDEIDSHLHVSLQRLILPFLIESFPQLQFIVTTHSPFILTSTLDTLVYDLGKDESCVISEVKSPNEVLRDYLGVPVAMPIWAENRLNEIMKKYSALEPDKISFESLKKELTESGLAEFFPESAAKILEAH
ncbi:MAG: AAA family ATPase [Spirochaetaceae bacterium]|jgi:predicted ATP-binding protein involved in virulence|nr:AAA family ATPase [Spirochaetaceae bacterium]